MTKRSSEQPTIESYLTGLLEKLAMVLGTLRQQCELLKSELAEQRDFIRSLKKETQDRDRMLTLREAAKVAGVSYETMIAWANLNELEAVNVAKRKGGRPRWRISSEALQRFLKTRARHRYELPQRRSRPLRNFRREYV